MAKLELKQISKSFGRQSVIKDLSVAVQEGELFVLLGPSGCGKSTVLRLISGLETPDTGEIRIQDRCVNSVPPKDRDVAMVFQNYALYPHLTVYDNLAFPLRSRRVAKAEIERVVRSQAELLGIEGLLERKPKSLSGGQRQRVALGRALVRQPKVFLFDEPLSNLDAKLRVAMRAEIKRLKSRVSATMLYVTHDQEEALSLGDTVGVLHGGCLQQVGTPAEIYSQPQNLFTAGFVGNPRMNFIEVTASSGLELQLVQGARLPVPSAWRETLARNRDRRLVLGIRPEHLALVESGGEELRCPCEIILSEFIGDARIIHGKVGSQDVRVKTGRAEGTAGATVTLHIPVPHCLLFDSETEKRVL